MLNKYVSNIFMNTCVFLHAFICAMYVVFLILSLSDEHVTLNSKDVL